MIKIKFFETNRDLLLSLFILIIFLVFEHLQIIEINIGPERFLQVYLTIFGVIFTVFAIFAVFENLIFYNIQKKGFKPLINKAFKYPMISSVIGVILSIATIPKFINIYFWLNFFVMIYALLSSLEVFFFVYNLVFELKAKKNK